MIAKTISPSSRGGRRSAGNNCESDIALAPPQAQLQKGTNPTQFTRWTRVKTSGTVKLIWNSRAERNLQEEPSKGSGGFRQLGIVGSPNEKAAPVRDAAL